MSIQIVLDTNVLISAVIFGGIPRKLLIFCLDRKITGVTSPMLLAEMEDVLIKKFAFSPQMAQNIKQKLTKKFLIVYPDQEIHVLTDEPDNRVLEAAIRGDCDYIVTGDKDLLTLGHYQKIRIVRPQKFSYLVSLS